MIKGKILKLISVFVILLMVTCTTKKKSPDENGAVKPAISVVNYPLYYFAKSIGGDRVTVYFPVIGGEPSHWKPEARQVSNFQNSDLILANGAGYAKWMEKVSLPSSKIVNTSSQFRDKWIETDEEIVHSHGPEGEHSHKGTASLVWLDFKLALLQSTSVHEALSHLLPDNRSELDANFIQLKKDLQELDNRAQAISAKLGDTYVIASHPVYQYFDVGYDIHLINMHWEPNDMPDAEAWENFEQLTNKHQAQIMIWEDQPNEEISSKLTSMGIHTTVFNVCGNKPKEGDFLDIMNENLTSLEMLVSKL